MLQYPGLYKNNRYFLFVTLYIPLFFAGLVGIYAKSTLMLGYWFAIARLLDKEAVPFLEKVSYFSLDILVNLFLVPCVVIAIIFFFFKKKALIVATLISCLLIIFYFIQFRVQFVVGQYASSELLYEAILFAMSGTSEVTEYVNSGAIIKLFFMLFVTVFCTVIVSMADKRFWLARVVRRGQDVLVGLVVASFAVALLFYPEKSWVL